jgi:delta 1-pyrroline-5-carboxylate dehydrogenase
MMVENVEAAGFNPGIFDAFVPSAAHVDRAATAEQQVEELLKSGKAFSASGHRICAVRGLVMRVLL